MLAIRLLQKFKSIRAIVNASEKELRTMEDIGHIKARAIIKFVNEEAQKKPHITVRL